MLQSLINVKKMSEHAVLIHVTVEISFIKKNAVKKFVTFQVLGNCGFKKKLELGG